ncbi:LysR family transcriptional regulator [Shewanella sp. Scap07]|uniref:LysR family transcriptional regulator n=1 Tax=Shewanella sp. Scap07 TaxID=2589987 RepID=UPI0015BE19B9|nr:LysR family transcriptional regulator [Shewanella sp. Scap07]QLE87411.1 LysR family transcriptional regulator [Shewanella sp. Scap07]
MKNNLEQLDLNLLRLLKVVVDTRNTSVTAERLGISQTSVSRGLAKLRDTFGDQLFIRKAHGVEPSELAEKLAVAAEQMLSPFTQVLDAYQSFDATKYQGDIVIACELTLLDIFGNGLYQSLRQALPQAKFKLVYWQPQSLQAMLARNIDYVLHYSMYNLPQEIYTHHLSNIALNLVARKNHPILKTTSDWQAIKDIAIVKHASDYSAKYDVYDELFITQGIEPNISLVSHSVPIIVDKLVHSDAISINSSYLLKNNQQLACYPLPPMPERLKALSISGGYLQSRRGYPLNQLLHQTIQDFFNAITQPVQQKQP